MSDPAEAGGGGNIIIILLLLSSACFCGGSTVGIIWQEKMRFFPGRVGNILGEVKKKTQKKWTIDVGTVAGLLLLPRVLESTPWKLFFPKELVFFRIERRKDGNVPIAQEFLDQ